MNKFKKINSLVLVFGIFYLIQNYTIGQISFFDNKYIFKPILLKEVVFLFSSIIICLILFDFRNKKYHQHRT